MSAEIDNRNKGEILLPGMPVPTNSHPIAAEAFKGLAERERLKAAFDALIICETAEELQEYLERAERMIQK